MANWTRIRNRLSGAEMSQFIDDARPESGDDAPARPDRRAVLEKLGTLSYYTPPVMLVLLLSPRPSAASTTCSGYLTPYDPNHPPCDPGSGGYT
jgi:hypothetical protein